MNFIGITESAISLLIFPVISLFGITLGGILGTIGGIFGGGKSSSQAQANFAKQLEQQKAELTRQMNLQAQESKKTLMVVAGGGLVLIILMFIFMKK